jgi:ABC-2 type transport system ATP-binding protein
MQSLVAENLSKQYGTLKALDNLNIELKGGKCVGFLGPNGAGKTTTLKLFTDMIRPTSGRALINGYDVRKEKKKALASCGALVETPEIYPSLTPRESLSMLAEMRGLPRNVYRNRIDEVISSVKMEDWSDQKVGKFSKGMKQRINVAAALLSDPEIIILDEPTSGLDPRGMAEVRDIVKSLKARNILVFMSSHLLAEVQEVCDEVAIIDHGKLLVYGRISDVVSKFSGSSSVRSLDAEFLKKMPIKTIESELKSSRGFVSVEPVDSFKIRIRFNGSLEEQSELLSKLIRAGIGITSFRESSSTALEDTYMNLIRETL